MKRTSILILFIVSILLYSFKPKKDKNPEFSASFIEDQFAYIPSGSFNYWEIFDTSYQTDSKIVTSSVQGFYLSKYEVSNELYLRFVTEQTKEEFLKTVLPDTLCWEKDGPNEKYIEYYFRHPAYANYPVVGVSYEQAILFCNWLTEKYNNFEKRKFKKVVFRLPSKYEWFRATTNKMNATFPWETSFLFNGRGHMNAAFKSIDQKCVLNNGTIVEEFDDSGFYDFSINLKPNKKSKSEPDPYFDVADPTVPIQFFDANAFGLFNMSGNVREMVAEKGYTKGGGWNDTGFYLRNCVIQTMKETNRNDVGFRPVMQIIETFD